MTPTDVRKQYLASQVAAATPLELTRMLMEGATQAVQEAIAAHRSGDILTRGNAVTRAVEILGELRFSLRREVAPQYCDTLSGLYGYLQTRLIQAHAEKSESMLQEAARLIQTLLEGWIGAMHNLSALDAGVNGQTLKAAPAPMNVLDPYSPEMAAEPQSRSWQF